MLLIAVALDTFCPTPVRTIIPDLNLLERRRCMRQDAKPVLLR